VSNDQALRTKSSPGLIAMPFALGSAVFVMAFDSTATPVALPAIAKALEIDELSTSGLVSAYLIASLCPLPLVAWLCARIGPRQALIAMLGLCAAGSIVCASGQGIGQLLLGRIMLGSGGAMLMPIARLIIARSVAQEYLVKAFSTVTLPVVLGPMLAPPIAGLLVTHTSWRLVPLVNLACIAIALVAVMPLVPRIAADPKARIDLKGAALAVLFLLLVGTGLATGVAALPLPVAGVVLLCAFMVARIYCRHAARTAVPIIDLRLMRLPPFRNNTIGIFLARIVTYAGPFLTTMMLQVGLGYSPDIAGGLFLFNALGSTASQLSVSAVVAKIGARRFLVVTSLLVPILFAATALLTRNTGMVVVCLLMFAQGFLRSGQLVVSSALAYGYVPRSRISQANNIVGIAQQFAGNAGLAAAALGMAAANLLMPKGGDALSQLQVAFVLVATVSAMGVPFLLRLPAGSASRS
jgi:MFS family permease